VLIFVSGDRISSSIAHPRSQGDFGPGELEAELIELATTSRLKEEPDEKRIQQWAIDTYRRRWHLTG
jgi:hypothetical protein